MELWRKSKSCNFAEQNAPSMAEKEGICNNLEGGTTEASSSVQIIANLEPTTVGASSEESWPKMTTRKMQPWSPTDNGKPQFSHLQQGFNHPLEFELTLQI